MWSVVGVYGGTEDHALYRQGLGGLIRAGGRLLQQGEVAILDHSAIHAVANSGPTFCEALHVYGGDLFAQPRTAWDEVTWRAGPYDAEQTQRRFEDANRRANSRQAVL
jgi:predicted metal-dependent enzyme (double-stranded beta helix superfamily)